jgi:hypothetical protein
MYQVDLAHEHERGTGKNRHHELALECDRYKERIVQYENDVNTLTHQVQRLQEASDKARAELEESVQKYEEKSRQKRKLYEMYTALKQKAENQGLLYSPAPPSQQTHVRYHAPSSPPPPPPQPAAAMATTPLLGAVVRYAAPSGVSVSFDDAATAHHSAFNSPSLRAASQVAASFGARDRFTAKSPRLSLDHSSVHHLDKFSALRSDFAKRARSPLSSIAAISMPPQQQQQHQAAPPPPPQVQQPPLQPQQSRMPLGDVTNVTFRAPTADHVGNNHNRSAPTTATTATTVPETSSFVALSYSATPLQSFAARLRRPQTPSRVRRSIAAPFNS